jgi:iron(III) transport system substrate-binding protein
MRRLVVECVKPWAALLLSAVVQLPSGFVEAGEAMAHWQAEWEKALHAAQQEGEIVVYGASENGALLRDFQRNYSQIKVTQVPGFGSATAQRILSERRAGKYVADLYMSGAWTGYNVLYKGKVLDPVKSTLLLPEVLDKSKWWKGRHKYADDKGEYLFSFNGEIVPYFAYNTKLVNPNEIRSYLDFLSPKWKGKMVMLDPAIGGPVGPILTFLYYTPELGPEFLTKLLEEMEVTISREERQIGDWLGVGRYSISLFTHVGRLRLDQAQKQGLPVDWFGPKNFKEGIALSSANGNVALLNRAPHPNAAKVFVNWLLSREAQIALQKINPGVDSLRIDIAKSDVPSYARRVEGVKYVDTETPGTIDIAPVFKFIKELGARKK